MIKIMIKIMTIIIVIMISIMIMMKKIGIVKIYMNKLKGEGVYASPQLE
jgi:hypothetical protein